MKYFVLLLALMLSGCSMLKPVVESEKSTYMIQPSKVNVVKARQSAKTLLVSRPRAAAGFDTDKMAYVLKPYEVAYFTKNRWADEPSHMLQPLIIQALQNTHHFHGVVTAPFTGNSNLRLDTQLVYLAQNFMSKPSYIECKLRVQLIDSDSEDLIAAKQFSYEEQAPTPTPYGGVIATNRVAEKFLQDLARFVVENS